jgi:gliding motility-associated-like protein
MGGTISLETNFTAFDWTYIDGDSLWTVFFKIILIEYPGYYHVLAYMDTSLYDTLPDLRIVNCSLMADTLVTDCKLVIPNVITPGGNGSNDFLGIKKLNPLRENELTIYDRWGKSVFHQKNYKCIFKGSDYVNTEEAFKGLSRGGQKLPDGTYYYAFKYASIPEKDRKTYTGVISIIWDNP